jgi:CO dehydrogenase maturation factor
VRHAKLEIHMRLAFAGKGGTGKTALAALVARAFAEQGRMVLAVDLDVNPGLAVSLGVSLDDRLLPDEAVEERPTAPYGWALAEHLTAAEAVRRCGIRVGPRIVYLGFGNIAHAEHSVRRYITAVRQVAEQFDHPGWVVVMDLGAGPTAVFEGHARAADLVLVVAEPTPASMLGAERLISILRHDGTPAALVQNETHPPQELDGPVGIAPFSTVPFDLELARLERTGSSSALPSHSRALRAVRDLAARIDARSSAVGGPYASPPARSGGAGP